MTNNLLVFRTAAVAFCEWAEENPGANPLLEAKTARSLLANLIAAAIPMVLPDVSSTAPEIGDEQWRRVFERCGSLPFNYYSEVFDPLVVPAEETVTADLADDLADIWRDVKGGLLLFDAGDTRGAEWHWAFNFSAHWGHHATAALYALQSWFSKTGDDLAWES